MTHSPSRDTITRFVFEQAPVRGVLVTLDAAARAILDCHPYPPALRRVLAELLAASALLSSMLKFSGSLIVQLQGSGPVRLLVVECNDALELRATAQWDAQRTMAFGPAATLAELAGGADAGPPGHHARPQGQRHPVPGHRDAGDGIGRGAYRALPRDIRAAGEPSRAGDGWQPVWGSPRPAAARRRCRRRAGAGRDVGARRRAADADRPGDLAGAGNGRDAAGRSISRMTTYGSSGRSR